MAESEATEAAQRKAEELGVDLAQVQGTGVEGRVTVQDVEKASENPDSGQEPKESPGRQYQPSGTGHFKVKLNPRLPKGSDAWIVNGRKFKGGEKVTEDEWEELSTARYTDPVSGSSCQVLLKGGEV